jgi:hypothetical protein
MTKCHNFFADHHAKLRGEHSHGTNKDTVPPTGSGDEGYALGAKLLRFLQEHK